MRVRCGPCRCYARIVALYERYAVLPLSDITREVRQASATRPQDEQQPLSAARIPRITLPQIQQQNDTATFVAAARLLQRSGEHQRAHAVLAGLPQTEVTSSLDVSREVTPHILQASSSPLTDTQADEAHSVAKSTTSASPPLAWLETNELVQRAFSLRRAHNAGTRIKEYTTLGKTYNEENPAAVAAVFRELLRRRAWLAAAQCMMNWHRRGLLILPSVIAEEQQWSDEAQHVKQSSLTSSSQGSVHNDNANEPFDVIAAFSPCLFADITNHTSEKQKNDNKVSNTGMNDEAHDAVWQTLLEHDAPLFAACLLHNTAQTLQPLLTDEQRARDGTAAALLRKITLQLLTAVQSITKMYSSVSASDVTALLDSHTAPLFPHVITNVGEDDEDIRALFEAVLQTSVSSVPSASELPVAAKQKDKDLLYTVCLLWAATAAVMTSAEAALRAGNKAEKQGMLYHAAKAIRGTQTVLLAVRQQMQYSSHDKLTGNTHREPTLFHMICNAVWSVVDILCRAVLGHEAQVRFIGLATFADVSIAYTLLVSTAQRAAHNTSHVALSSSSLPRRINALPGTLLACLFLCMGGPPYKPAQTIEYYNERRIGRDTNDEYDALRQYLCAAPLERWQYALLLLTQHVSPSATTHTSDTTTSSSVQLRCVLSGLQSISFRLTWHQALRCTEVCMQTLHIIPDDATMVKLVHNLRQVSWQRAFDVLKFYAQRHISPAAAVLRDLQLIACKYDPHWRTTVELMEQLIREHGTRAAGLLCYLYSLHAVALSGGAEELPRCCELFLRLKTQTLSSATHQSSTTIGKASPYTAACVAVPLVAMLDGAHFAEAATFATWLRQPDTLRAMQPCELSEAARRVAAAGELLGLLFSDQHDALTALLIREDKHTQGNATSEKSSALGTLNDSPLTHVLRTAVELYWMMDMRALHAPVRLVYDVLEPGRYVTLDAVGNFETKTSAGRVPQTLYIPPQHRRKQNVRLAMALGRYVKARSVDTSETNTISSSNKVVLPSSIACTIAACMTSCQVGPEYLRAAIL